jgi:hypothetical protein
VAAFLSIRCAALVGACSGVLAACVALLMIGYVAAWPMWLYSMALQSPLGATVGMTGLVVGALSGTLVTWIRKTTARLPSN